jgi:hypothetical protein
LAASSRTAAVVAWMKTYAGPSPKLRCASWDSIVWLDTGTIPASLVITKTPANIAISNPTIQLSVVRALRHSVGLNTGTAFEMASMPVMAVQPGANARRTSRTPRLRGLGGGHVCSWALREEDASRPRARA